MQTIAKLLLVVLVGCGVDAVTPDTDATITYFENDEYHVENGHGVYKYRFETTNGIRREEEGFVQDPTNPNSELVVKGSYSYLTPSGEIRKVSYVSDKNGYRQGDGKSVSTDGPVSPTPAEGAFPDIVLPDGRLGTELTAKRIGTPLLASLSGGGVG